MTQQLICPRCGSAEIVPGKRWCICDDCGERFMRIGDKAANSLKLFFSYSHTEAVICEMISKYFTKRGHDVWIDKDRISPGDDWREKIAKGLVESNGVVAFLSERSVRDPGVCLNELSIAVGVRGGNIKTVLLEPEKKVTPPASISHIQWLDMSSWREEYAKGEAHFSEWFRVKMEQLTSIVEAPENLAFDGQISAIRAALPLIGYDNSKLNNLLRQPFVGRQWLTERVERWISDPAGESVCVLYGDPGVGKSAFAANYSHYNSRVAAAVFCEYNRSYWRSSGSVIQTLAYLLACRIPEYRVFLTDILKNTPNIGELSAAEMFEQLLAVPLSEFKIDGGHETVCIVIDGLDECGSYQQNELAEVLARCVHRFPKWIRFLITTRKVDYVRGLLDGMPSLELTGDAPDNMADVRRYFELLLGDYLQRHGFPEDFTDNLVAKSEGIFLYARLISNAILNGKLTPDDPEALPDGMTGAFHRWFSWFFDDVQLYADRFRIPMGMIAFSPEPIPAEELCPLSGLDENEINELLSRISVLIRRETNADGRRTVELLHKYLKDWLGSERAGVYRCSREATLRRMGETAAERYLKDNSALTRYETLYMVPFLLDTGSRLTDAVAFLPQLYLLVSAVGEACLEQGLILRAGEYFHAAFRQSEYCLSKSDTPDARLMHSISELHLGEICEAQGNLRERDRLFQSCYETRRRLLEERGSENDRKCFGTICEGMSQVCCDRGDTAGGRRYLEEALPIREALNAQRGSAEDKKNLASNYKALAEMYDAEGKVEEADELFRKSLETRRGQMQRGNHADKKDLLVALVRYAAFLQHCGRYSDSPALLRETELLIDSFRPEELLPETVRAIMFCNRYYADYLSATGDLEGAEKRLLQSVRYGKQLLADRGSVNDYWYLGGAYVGLANFYYFHNEYEKAENYVCRTLDIDKKLTAERGTLEDIFGLCYSLMLYGKILFYTGREAEAEAVFRQATPQLEMCYQTRGGCNDREYLAGDYQYLARCALFNGNTDEASALCEQALALRRSQSAYRGSPDDFGNLGATLIVWGDILTHQKRWEEAEQAYLEVVACDRQNCAQNENFTYYDDYCYACIITAEFYLKRGDHQACRAYAEEAQEILRKVQQKYNTKEEQYYEERLSRLFAQLPTP